MSREKDFLDGLMRANEQIAKLTAQLDKGKAALKALGGEGEGHE